MTICQYLHLNCASLAEVLTFSFDYSVLGETINFQLASLLKSLVGDKCRIRNHYGPAEITINCTHHLIDMNIDQTSIPLGQLLPNYQCCILDEFLQPVCVGHKGELLVAGIGVFLGYLEPLS